MTRLWRRWLDAGLPTDLLVSVALPALLWIAWRLSWWSPGKLFPVVLAADAWADFLNTLASVASTIVGFVTTAIAVTITIGAGRRGRRVVRSAGRSLKSVLQRCLAVAVLALALLAVGSGLDPKISIFVPLALAAVLALLALNVLRLYSLLISLVWVSILDASAAGEDENAR